MNKISKEELEGIQSVNRLYTEKKLELGNLEVRKFAIINEIEKIKERYFEQEKALIIKYGADAVINGQTGEITTK